MKVRKLKLNSKLKWNYIKGKFHRGKRVVGQWVFGGVERGSGKCFLLPVEDRRAETLIKAIEDETLIKAIEDWIAPGTTIYSDCWASYNGIK